MDFSNKLAELFNLQLPSTLVFDYPSIEAIAQYLNEVVDCSRIPNAVHPTTPLLVSPQAMGVGEMDVEVGLRSLQIACAMKCSVTNTTDLADRIMTSLPISQANSTTSMSFAVRLPISTSIVECGTLDAIGIVPYSRWDLEAIQIGEKQMQVRFGGFLHGIDCFDVVGFGIAMPEAKLMDPQQRILLEV